MPNFHFGHFFSVLTQVGVKGNQGNESEDLDATSEAANERFLDFPIQRQRLNTTKN